MNDAAERAQAACALVIEDEMMIAMLVEDILTEAGFKVLGPVATVEDALSVLRSGQRIDVAIMDLNLAGKSSLTLADVFAQGNIRFMVMTGYGVISLPAPHQSVPVLSKPFDPAELLDRLAQIGLPAPDRGD